MKYFKVPVNLDGRAVIKKGLYCGKIQRFLIKNELYTAKELEKYGITETGVIPVDIPQSREYWFFGARSDLKEA